MNSPAVGLRVASVLFGIGAVVHAFRLALHFNILVDGRLFPLWGSMIGVVVAGLLCGWLWSLSNVAGKTLAHR